jgi:hypothetical protein
LTGLAIDLNLTQNIKSRINGIIQKGHTVDLGVRVLNDTSLVLVKFLCEDIEHGLELAFKVFLLFFDGLVRGKGIDVDFSDLFSDTGVGI